MSSQIMCVFHPERIAKTTCARCHRPICLEDIRTIQRSYPHHAFDSHFSHHKFYGAIDFCPICYAEVLRFQTQQLNKISVASGMASGVFVVALLGILGILALIVVAEIRFFPSFPSKFVLIILLIPILMFVGFKMMAGRSVGMQKSIMSDLTTMANEQAIQADKDRETYLAILERKEAKARISSETFVLKCFQCGSRIYPGDQYCANCGDPTTEEMQSREGKK